MFKVLSKSPQETIKLGQNLAQRLKKGDIICLSGDLGSGKTTFVKGLAKGFKISHKRVNSPTFVLMNIYQGKIPIYHFDLYRLETVKQIEGIGCEEFFYGQGVSVIEWAEKLGTLMPERCIRIEFKHGKNNQRLIKIYSKES